MSYANSDLVPENYPSTRTNAMTSTDFPKIPSQQQQNAGRDKSLSKNRITGAENVMKEKVIQQKSV